VNERPLPRTEGQMLQSAEWQRVVDLRRTHRLPNRHCRGCRNPFLDRDALRKITS
jgi:hypothetical protein